MAQTYNLYCDKSSVQLRHSSFSNFSALQHVHDVDSSFLNFSAMHFPWRFVKCDVSLLQHVHDVRNVNPNVVNTKLIEMLNFTFLHGSEALLLVIHQTSVV